MTGWDSDAAERWKQQKLDELSRATWLPECEKTRFRKMIEWQYERLLKYLREHRRQAAHHRRVSWQSFYP